MKQPVGYLIFTLHSHLPFVLNHGRWPFGSDWLSEAAVQSYLPLLRSLTLLADEDVIPTVTITLSPILCEQLANPGFGEEITAFLQQRLEACRDNRRHFADTGGSPRRPVRLLAVVLPGSAGPTGDPGRGSPRGFPTARGPRGDRADHLRGDPRLPSAAEPG